MAHVDSISTNLKRRRRIRAKFRGIIRTIIINKIWVSQQEDQPISSNVQKNLTIITRRQRQVGILTALEKNIISKSIEKRTIEEKKLLVTLVAQLKCLSKIPPKIRARIAPHLNYIYVQVGRNLFKEGHLPRFVYFILNGEIAALKDVYSIVTDQLVEKPIFVIGSGDTLGEFAFVEQKRRPFTYRVTRDVEALYLETDEFEQILLPYIREQWNTKKYALSSFDYFNNWTESQLSYACQHGIIRQYEPMETIYHEDKGLFGQVYFILSGECMILQFLKIKCKKVKRNKQYRLCDINDASEAMTDNKKNLKTNSNEWEIENHFTDVGSLKFGAIFGLGEDMTQRAIMARTMVQCFLLPRFWLYERDQNPGNMWQRLKFHLNSTIPSREILFHDFISTQKWQDFKKVLLTNYLENSGVGNPTKIEDIPVICRIIESTFEDHKN